MHACVHVCPVYRLELTLVTFCEEGHGGFGFDLGGKGQGSVSRSTDSQIVPIATQLLVINKCTSTGSHLIKTFRFPVPPVHPQGQAHVKLKHVLK